MSTGDSPLNEMCATTWLSRSYPLGLCSFADALLTAIANTTVRRRTNLRELNSTNLIVLILFIVASREMSLIGNNGLFDLLFLVDRRACWKLVLEIHGPLSTPRTYD
jgi:hypothetical protein